MCVCRVPVQFVNELLSISMNTITRSLRRQTKESVYASFYKNPCRQVKVCIAWSLRWQTHKGNRVCLVLKACADKRKYVYPRAYAHKQKKVCMLRSKNPCRQAKVCIARSLRWQTHKGKCVCLVLKACAEKRKYVYTPQSLRRQTKESVHASF